MNASINTPVSQDDSSRWKNVSRNAPCRVCGKPDYCSYLEDGSKWMCRRMGDVGSVHKLDKHGVEFWLHFSDTFKSTNACWASSDVPVAAVQQELAGADTATRDERHKAYSALIEGTGLLDAHRGVLPEAVGERLFELGYRSVPDTEPAEQMAISALRRGIPTRRTDDWLRIPGTRVVVSSGPLKDEAGNIVTRKEYDPVKGMAEVAVMEEKHSARLVTYEGMFIPVRDHSGRIVALRVRKDDESNGKYVWWRGDASGSAAEMMAHVALLALPRERLAAGGWAETIRITEGEKKADIATILTGVLTIGLPSVGAWRLAEEPVQRLKPKHIILSFDSDGRKNPGVAGAWCRAILHHVARQYRVSAEIWDPAAGKGIDDVLLSDPTKVRTLEGLALLEEVQSWLKASGAPPSAELDARIVIERARLDVAERPELASSDEITRAIAVLERTHNGHRFEAEFEAIAVKDRAKTKFEAGLKEARRSLADAEKLAKEESRIAVATAMGGIVFERGDNAEIADKLILDLRKTKAVVFDTGSMHTYDKDDCIWTVLPEHELSRRVIGYAGSVVRGQKGGLRINSTSSAVSMAQDLANHTGFFERAPKGFAFSNGFLEVTPSGLQLRKHDPKYGARSIYDFAYDPGVEAPPEWTKFLREIFSTTSPDLDGQETPEEDVPPEYDVEEKIAYLQEFLGLSLLGLAPRLCGAALLLLGDGANGKSTLMEVVQACFPPGTVCGVPPQAWNDSQKLALMEGRRLNIVGETPSKDVEETANYKAVITGDAKVQIKNVYEKPYEATMEAGNIFLLNLLFASGDGSHGFWRRNVVIPMTRTFLEHEQDKTLVPKLLASRQGIVHWLLAGAARAVKRGKITRAPSSSKDAIDEWKSQSDPVRRWVLAECRGEVDSVRLKNEKETYITAVSGLYTYFRSWAKANGHKEITSATFASRLRPTLMDLAKTNPMFFVEHGVADPDDAEIGIRQVARYGHRAFRTEGRRLPLRWVGTDRGEDNWLVGI